MDRLKCSLVATVLAVAVSVVAAGPAFAGAGGVPTKGACGRGKTTAHDAIQDPTSPGATEAAKVNPVQLGCTGQGPL